MRWLLSLIIGLLLAWVIVLTVPKNTSNFQTQMDPINIKQLDDSLVSVGLAQYTETKSIMDSINQPVPFSYGPVPNLNVIQGSSPSPDFIPSATPAPSPVVPASPASSPMSPVPASPESSPMSPAPTSPASSPMSPAPASPASPAPSA
jgi:hypothetical protein